MRIVGAVGIFRIGPLCPSASYFGKSSAGFCAKKFTGFNSNSCHTVGITGQSSECGTFRNPV
jgi:hypothetical protein